MKKLTSLGGAIIAASLLVACSAGAADAVTPASESSDVALPPTSGVFDYQLGGSYDELDLGGGPTAIDVVVRDATSEPLDGAYSVCYVNGFQTQPDDAEFWLEREDLLLHDSNGELVIDPEWPDEYVLDPSTSAQRDGILEILGPVIDGCEDDGFDAVEIDNLDTWTRFDEIDESGAHALAEAYVTRTHDAGMAIAQKNSAEITQVAHDEIGFDFAVTEECGVWEECAAYTDVYGDHVLQIEYPEALEKAGMTFDEVCVLADRAPLTILRDVELVPAGSSGYVYDAC
ncbi:MAG: endo alpha-1,4 polygalactosaminidase [Microbacterium gubbeenense]|uniref:endo alpha-1,4 polygalactosaminidase n=1 Tax=Microbacterium gubbeenense TaxID=159896 RepID=UPI003F9922A4